MRRAPANPKSQSPRAGGKSRGGMLLGLFLGLVVGVLIAFGIVWYLNKTPLPFQDKTSRADKPAEKAAAPAVAGQPPKAPEPLPGKPGDKVAEKPRFEFYKILPGGQEATPAPATAPAAQVTAVGAKASTEPMYLQAGSFQKAADADNLKAKLSLLGVDVNVQEAAIPDKGTMYRVKVGPFAKTDEMNRVRNQLAQNGIQATVVKTK